MKAVKQEITFDALGTVGEFVGKNGKLGYTKENISKAGVQVQLTLMSDDNKEIRKALLSQELSLRFRTKELSLGNVLTLPWSKASNGVYYIHRTQATVIWADAKDLAAKEYEPVAITDEDLVAL